MDREVNQPNQSRIPIVKVRWKFSKKSQFQLGTRTSDATCKSAPFHPCHFRDLHKLNFGTKFPLGGETVTTRHFRSFSNFREIYYSSFTIHRLLFIDFTIHHFRTPFVIPRSVTIHVTLFIPTEKSLFMVIIHFIVDWVYGYSNLHNRLGLAVNSCIIIRNTSYRLGLVYILSS